MNKKSMLYVTLCRALSIKRGHKGEAVKYFTDWLANAVPERLNESIHVDAIGNLHVDNRHDETSRTLFVAHVDTVHREDGANKIYKTKHMWYADGAPLGADDGAGCAMLMHMLHANVAGYYIFTQGEECGGIGATYLAEHSKELLGEFDRAIAFDRKGIDSVISHQGWGRCCSDAFAQALSDALNSNDAFMYSPDDTGVYTDTAEFTDYIPECTNISVGYDKEHSDKESLDIRHYEALAETVLVVPWDKLPTSRKAGEVDDKYYTPKAWAGNWSGTGSQSFAWSDDDYEKEILYDALTDAEFGMPDDLFYLIGDACYPDDPEFVFKFLDPRKLTPSIIKDAELMLEAFDAHTVLNELFDHLYHPTH